MNAVDALVDGGKPLWNIPLDRRSKSWQAELDRRGDARSRYEGRCSVRAQRRLVGAERDRRECPKSERGQAGYAHA
ncbi:hypothetical protein [Bradyrhizobium sp. RDI18]|uniref:hypothetical protein n=1 Tax=Bradyrhizobium sp. RDI18 TaxID=3367400 RepID=UPI00371C4A9F